MPVRRLPNPTNIKPVSDEEASRKRVSDIRKRVQGKLPPVKLPYGPASADPYLPKSEPVQKNIDKAPLTNDVMPDQIRSFKQGGVVRRTGLALVHKGERVIPASAASLGAGKRKPRAKRKIKKTMDEWKAGTLHSGSKQGPVVRNQKQAVAIALSQARKEK